mgnify:CR=1 FL=1
MLEDQELWNFLCEIAGSDNVRRQEPMKKHTTFRIGGPADYFVVPHSREEIRQAIEVCRSFKVPCYILGNGSNLLVGDKGYRGVVIQIYKNFCSLEIQGEEIHVEAGALLGTTAKKAMKASLAGLEFASGIPGTVGGAVAMNAGAYGGEMKDVLKEIAVLTEDGRFLTIPREELDLGYRTSIVSKKGYIVLDAVLSLKKGNREEIEAKMEELKSRRVEKQPLEYPSAGSTFKRPEGYFAGKLIMDAGLRGFSVGGAMVSEKHCGFVINRGDATAKDVRDLMDAVSRKVREQFGVELEPEVKMLGEFE